MLLQANSLAVFLGRPFGEDTLKSISMAYHNSSEQAMGRRQQWKQRIVLCGRNIQQLRNFLRRCRDETKQGFQFRYFCLLDFNANDDCMAIVQRRHDYRLSLVLYGVCCIDGVPPEVKDQVDYLLVPDMARELVEGAIPVINARQITKGNEMGVLDIPLPSQKEPQAESNLTRAPSQRVQQQYEDWRARVVPGAAIPTSKRKRPSDAVPDFCRDFRGFKAMHEDLAAKEEAQMTEERACQIMGLNPDGRYSKDQLKACYRKLQLKYHPDKNDNDPAAAEQFMLVQQAFQFVSEFIQ